ncbi:NAD-dependent deacylase, partial [bacterium]|nr:NAD-dependent deacylase [bacterium]
MGKEKEALDLINSSKYIVSLTGAGISVESGIPTFRGKGGLWEKYNPEIYGTLSGLTKVFLFSPSKVVNFAYEFGKTICQAKPNRMHFFLSDLEKNGNLKAVITQNIDNLHQKAGSKNVIELHGNFFRWFCKKCGKEEIFGESEIMEFLETLKKTKGRKNLIKKYYEFTRCECGGHLRPSIVFFGELLPEREYRKAEEEMEKCDLVLTIGTSGVVSPAADLPFIAKRRGAKLIDINPGESNFRN